MLLYCLDKISKIAIYFANLTKAANIHAGNKYQFQYTFLWPEVYDKVIRPFTKLFGSQLPSDAVCKISHKKIKDAEVTDML